MTTATISQVELENASPAATSFVELETAAGVSEHALLSAIRTLFKTTYDGLYQPTDAELTALSGLTSAASSFPYFTGSGTASLLVIVAAIRTLLASADVATFRTNAGLAIGTDVLAYNANSAVRNPTAASYSPASGSQTVALDVTNTNHHTVLGHTNGTAITFTVTGATNDQVFAVSILQGGTTVSTIAGWFATVRWAAGTIPTLTATLNKRDTFIFKRTGANTYDGWIVGQNH